MEQMLDIFLAFFSFLLQLCSICTVYMYVDPQISSIVYQVIFARWKFFEGWRISEISKAKLSLTVRNSCKHFLFPRIFISEYFQWGCRLAVDENYPIYGMYSHYWCTCILPGTLTCIIYSYSYGCIYSKQCQHPATFLLTVGTVNGACFYHVLHQIATPELLLGPRFF